MKIEKINNTDYKIIICKKIIQENDIISYIKDLLEKYKIKLNLKGFYRIIVYNRFFGLYLKIIQIEDSYYKDTFDYRIIFDDTSNFYFKTTDYFVVSSCLYIYYLDGYYYALVDDSFDKIFEKVEFGLFELESDFDFLNKGFLVRYRCRL